MDEKNNTLNPQKSISPIAIVTTVLLAVYGIAIFVGIMKTLEWWGYSSYVLIGIIEFLAVGVMIVSLFVKLKNNLLAIIGTCVLCAGMFFRIAYFDIISSIKNYASYVDGFYYYEPDGYIEYIWGSVFNLIGDIFGLFAVAAMAVLIIFASLKIQKRILEFAWFVPAALIILEQITFLFGGWGFRFEYLLAAIAFALFALVNVEPSYMKALFNKQGTTSAPGPSMAQGTNTANTSTGNGNAQTQGSQQTVYTPYPGALESAKMSIAAHVLLLLFTCGIWYLIWIYKTTEYLNRVKSQDAQTPVYQLLLNLIPYYPIYWAYKNGERTNKLAAEYGVGADVVIPSVLLAIFAVTLMPIIIQCKINEIIESVEGGPNYSKPNQASQSCPAAQAEVQAANVVRTSAQATVLAANTSVDVAPSKSVNVGDELREYKSLLDEGIITQEEFDAKKKQLLNL